LKTKSKRMLVCTDDVDRLQNEHHLWNLPLIMASATLENYISILAENSLIWFRLISRQPVSYEVFIKI
jgi:hypothetical protein